VGWGGGQGATASATLLHGHFFVIYIFHSHNVLFLEQELANFSIKDQIGNSFSFVGHTVSSAAIQLCFCSALAVTGIV